MKRSRPQFAPKSLFNKVHGIFKQLSQGDSESSEITTADCLMSALAMFSLKYPSLLRFEQDRVREPTLRHNLLTLYGVKRAPCDTYMRERLDGLPLSFIRTAMKSIIHLLQRSKVLENWKFLDKYYLVSVDGTGFFSSPSVRCEQCCTTVHNRGKENEQTTYNHKMLVGSIVHPGMRQVLPIGFEPIVKSDGDKKNDCERNAAKRWLENFRRSHPQLEFVFLGDGLHANGPLIREVLEHRGHFLCVARDDDHKLLNEYFWGIQSPNPDVVDFTEEAQGMTRRYRFMHNVPLNDANPDLLVTVIYCEEINKKKEKVKWTWVTNLDVTEKTVRRIAEGARTRFKIENETFNTLKNQGYNLEHNYGHGYKTLSNIFAGLMLVSFLIDQCLEAVNVEFKAALTKCVSRVRLWEKTRALFFYFHITSWDALYGAILDPPHHTL